MYTNHRDLKINDKVLWVEKNIEGTVVHCFDDDSVRVNFVNGDCWYVLYNGMLVIDTVYHCILLHD